MQTRFSPGRAWAAAAGGRVAILSADAAPEEVTAVHAALADGVPTGVLLAEAEHRGRPLAILDHETLARRSGVPAEIDGRALPSADRDDLVAEPVDGSEVRIGLLSSLTAAVFPLNDGVARVAGIIANLEPVSADTLAPEEMRAIVTSADEPATGHVASIIPSAPEAPAGTPPAEPAAAGIAGIIDSVPGFSRPTPPSASSAAPPSAPQSPPRAAPAPAPASAPVAHDLGDHDGSTVRAEDARALVERFRAERADRASSTPPTALDGRTVLSSVCGAGHANPPEEARCLICGQPIAPGSLEQRPQPEVAVATMPGGERVPLIDGAVFGRRPRSRTAGQTPPPKLIVVESPHEDISRSHLEMRIDGWSVVAEDLGSTNGTMLLRAGQPSQRLRPDSPVILQLGDRLDLGEGVVIEVQAP